MVDKVSRFFPSYIGYLAPDKKIESRTLLTGGGLVIPRVIETLLFACRANVLPLYYGMNCS